VNQRPVKLTTDDYTRHYITLRTPLSDCSLVDSSLNCSMYNVWRLPRVRS